MRRCAGGWEPTSTQKGSLNAPDRLRFDVSPAAPDDGGRHRLRWKRR